MGGYCRKPGDSREVSFLLSIPAIAQAASGLRSLIKLPECITDRWPGDRGFRI